jgi:hypothetical protein
MACMPELEQTRGSWRMAGHPGIQAGESLPASRRWIVVEGSRAERRTIAVAGAGHGVWATGVWKAQ